MAWNDIPEFDSSSSSQDDNPFTGSRTSHTGKVSVKALLMSGCAGNLKKKREYYSSGGLPVPHFRLQV